MITQVLMFVNYFLMFCDKYYSQSIMRLCPKPPLFKSAAMCYDWGEQERKGGEAMTKRTKRLLAGAVLLLGLAVLWWFLQGPFAHRLQPFSPAYGRVDLEPILDKAALEAQDYDTLYIQTGLGPAAVDDLRAMGSAGVAQILATQDAFFTQPCESSCSNLGITTKEHRFLDDEGYMVYAAPLAPLKEGDILVSLSTHTAGWTHGHAGLVLDPDPERPVTLESVVLGTRSSAMNANHWRSYTTFLVLRPKGDDAKRQAVVDIANQHLTDIPYSLLSGVFGEKFQPPEGDHSAQCGYLPWYAWMAVGLDLDSDGGRIVTPADLAESPNVEVVQLYGLDPEKYPYAR